MERTILIAALGAAVALAGCSERRAPVSRTVSPVAATPATAFADVLPRDFPGGPMTVTDRCALDSLNRVAAQAVTSAAVGGSVSISGWMAADDATIADPSLVVRLAAGTRSFYARTTKRAARHDVNSKLGVDAANPTGFELDAALDAVPAGDYDVSLLAPARGGVAECATKRRLHIG